MAGSRRRDQQVPAKKSRPRASQHHVGSRNDTSSSNPVYILLVCIATPSLFTESIDPLTFPN